MEFFVLGFLAIGSGRGFFCCFGFGLVLLPSCLSGLKTILFFYFVFPLLFSFYCFSLPDEPISSPRVVPVTLLLPYPVTGAALPLFFPVTLVRGASRRCLLALTRRRSSLDACLAGSSSLWFAALVHLRYPQFRHRACRRLLCVSRFGLLHLYFWVSIPAISPVRFLCSHPYRSVFISWTFCGLSSLFFLTLWASSGVGVPTLPLGCSLWIFGFRW